MVATRLVLNEWLQVEPRLYRFMSVLKVKVLFLVSYQQDSFIQVYVSMPHAKIDFRRCVAPLATEDNKFTGTSACRTPVVGVIAEDSAAIRTLELTIAMLPLKVKAYSK